MFSKVLVLAAGASLAAAATTNTNLQSVFPVPSTTTALAAVKTITGSFDGEMKQWDRNRKPRSIPFHLYISSAEQSFPTLQVNLLST
jgi:hypothetical protein